MHRLIYESKRKQRINNIAIYYITPPDKAAFVGGFCILLTIITLREILILKTVRKSLIC